MEERKFVCKYCSKRFPCGKSLGGHIRTHMMSEHSAQANEAAAERRSNAAMLKLDAAERKRKRDSGYGGGGGGGGDDGGGGCGGNLMYGLRENPKKTTRFVHSNATSSQMEKFCKECGKGFPSLKALCGHMACHSEKDRGTTNLSEKQKLVMDTQSDTETSAPTHPRRSKRMRFTFNSPSSLANGSSSVSEVEQEQQEEVARCLMMLSKDSSYKGRFALVTDSSDNNSVVLEAKSPSVTFNFGKSFVSNAYDHVVEKKKLHMDNNNNNTKLKSTAEIGYDSDNSDSGYFRYGPKKVESDEEESSDGFFRNEVKSSKVGYLSGFEGYDVESRKMMLSRGRGRDIEHKKLVLKDLDHEHKKFGSRKRLTYDSVGQKTETLDHGGGKGWKKNNNGFLINERDNGSGSEDSAYESDENTTDSDSYPASKPHKNLNVKKSSSSSKGKKKLKSKKSKEHECPICNKIFRSGQALGGHKRSHFVGGSEENTLVIRPGAAAAAAPAAAAAVAVPCLIDLNLPAPVDE